MAAPVVGEQVASRPSSLSSSAGEAVTYNSLGQTTSLTPAGGSAEAFTYTGVGQSQRTSAGGATLTNNAFGVASQKTGSTTTYFTWQPNGRLNSLLTGATLASAKRYYYLYDGTGNVIGLINATGTRVATYSYSPYGTTTASTGGEAGSNPFRYEGGYTDTTGDIHFGDRYLNPALGSLTQPDPMSAVFSYSYAGDDPMSRVDPTGESWWTSFVSYWTNWWGGVRTIYHWFTTPQGSCAVGGSAGAGGALNTDWLTETSQALLGETTGPVVAGGFGFLSACALSDWPF